MNSIHRSQSHTFLKVIVVFLILAINTHFVGFAHSTELPNEDKIVLYVNNLLLSYNSLVHFYGVYEPYFSNYEEHFSLYFEEGDSFRVICVKSDQNDTENLNFIFIKIRSTNPDIVLDFNHSLNDYVEGILLKGRYCYVKNYLIDYFDTYLHTHLILSVISDDIIDNTMEDSKEYADFLYENDKDSIRKERINEIWEPFIENNEESISSIYNLSSHAGDIERNISSNKSYTYEIFLQEFYEFEIKVTHYRELPLMTERYEDLINSERLNNIKVKEDSELSNKLTKIEDNIESNEQYLYENFESDLREIEDIILVETERQARDEERQFSILMQIIFTIISMVGGFIGGYYFNSWMSRRKEDRKKITRKKITKRKTKPKRATQKKKVTKTRKKKEKI